MQGPVLEVEEVEDDTLTVLVVGVHEMIEGICLWLDLLEFRCCNNSGSVTNVNIAYAVSVGSPYIRP